MSTLDNSPHEPYEQVSFFQTALKYGLIGAATSIIFSLVSNLLGLSDQSNPSTALSILMSILSVVIYLAMQISAVKYHRDKESNGYISFGRAFLVCIVVAMIIAIINSIWSYIYMSYIDPEMLDRIIEMTIEQSEEKGMSEQDIEMSVSIIEMMSSPFAQLLMGVVFGALVGGIGGLITSAVLKKEAPLA